MQEPMRMPHIDDQIELKFKGPSNMKHKIIAAAKQYGYVEADTGISWESIYPESSPGTRLAGARYRENVTQKQLSQLTGISLRQISEMENGKRTINKDSALIFSKVLHCGYKVFL